MADRKRAEQEDVEEVAYTFDHFTIRDRPGGKELYKVPFSVYEKMHGLVAHPESGPIIKRVRAMKI